MVEPMPQLLAHLISVLIGSVCDETARKRDESWWCCIWLQWHWDNAAMTAKLPSQVGKFLRRNIFYSAYHGLLLTIIDDLTLEMFAKLQLYLFKYGKFTLSLFGSSPRLTLIYIYKTCKGVLCDRFTSNIWAERLKETFSKL